LASKIGHVAAFRELAFQHAAQHAALFFVARRGELHRPASPSLWRSGPRQMLSLILSFIAFFVASYFIRRYLDEMEIPRTMTRGIVILVLALGVSYGVAFLVGLF
jgi:hypothetical protein